MANAAAKRIGAYNPHLSFNHAQCAVSKPKRINGQNPTTRAIHPDSRFFSPPRTAQEILITTVQGITRHLHCHVLPRLLPVQLPYKDWHDAT